MAVFKPPQRKKHYGPDLYNPFPIPISSITKTKPSPSQWNYYEGYLEQKIVVVKKKGDMRKLISQGSFGKLIRISEPIQEENTLKEQSKLLSKNDNPVLVSKGYEDFQKFGMGAYGNDWKHVDETSECPYATNKIDLSGEIGNSSLQTKIKQSRTVNATASTNDTHCTNEHMMANPVDCIQLLKIPEIIGECSSASLSICHRNNTVANEGSCSASHFPSEEMVTEMEEYGPRDQYVHIKDHIVSTDGHFQEHLWLSFRESFFLSYALGCLFVKDKDDSTLDLLQQWRAFCKCEPHFPVMYAAYHHFRSKGWVPKDGIRYGSDFVLYRKGPSFYHASYIVVIQVVDADSLQAIEFNGVPSRNFSWVTLSGLLRLATTVSKELMFCYILVPGTLRSHQIESPECLKLLSVREKIISRWTSTKERDKELLDIDCHY